VNRRSSSSQFTVRLRTRLGNKEEQSDCVFERWEVTRNRGQSYDECKVKIWHEERQVKEVPSWFLESLSLNPIRSRPSPPLQQAAGPFGGGRVPLGLHKANVCACSAVCSSRLVERGNSRCRETCLPTQTSEDTLWVLSNVPRKERPHLILVGRITPG